MKRKIWKRGVCVYKINGISDNEGHWHGYRMQGSVPLYAIVRNQGLARRQNLIIAYIAQINKPFDNRTRMLIESGRWDR
jgi:hypothetical protein